MEEKISFYATFFPLIFFLKQVETFIAKYKIKKGFISEINKWSRELNNRKLEVMETLEKEGVFVECAFIDSIGDDHYLIYFMKCIDIKKVFEQLEKSKLNIDVFHKETLSKCLEKPFHLKKIIDFENIALLKDKVDGSVE